MLNGVILVSLIIDKRLVTFQRRKYSRAKFLIIPSNTIQNRQLSEFYHFTLEFTVYIAQGPFLLRHTLQFGHALRKQPYYKTV